MQLMYDMYDFIFIKVIFWNSAQMIGNLDIEGNYIDIC